MPFVFQILFYRVIEKENQHRKSCPACAPLYPTLLKILILIFKRKNLHVNYTFTGEFLLNRDNNQRKDIPYEQIHK
jgi:hypothetical protein